MLSISSLVGKRGYDEGYDLDDGETPVGVYPNVSPKCCPCLPFDIYPYFVLVCICMLTFGSYWVYDTPGAIQTQLTFWFGGPYFYSNAKNSLLYSVYGFPNMILAFFGGVIMDKWIGVRMGGILMCGLVFIGQTVFALGIMGQAYTWCVIGRFIFGLGGESLTVAQNTFTARWFDGKTLALAFGMVLAFSRIGSAINFAVTPVLADIGVPFSVWFGTFLCLLSLLFTFGCSTLDYVGRTRIKRQVDADEAPLSFADIKAFPIPAWVLMLVCGFFYVAVLTFYTVASNIMQHTGQNKGQPNQRGYFSPNIASAFIAIPNLVSIIGAPIFGKLVDHYGRALWFQIGASCLLMLCHVMMLGNGVGWWFISPIPIFVIIGVAYSAGASSLWPILSYIIPTKTLSTAYGTMTSLQNCFLTVFPLITSAVLDAKGLPAADGYAICISIFILCAAIAAFLAFLLIGLDLKFTDGKLNMSGEEKRRRALDNDAEQGSEHKNKLAHLPANAASAAAYLSFLEEAQVEGPVIQLKREVGDMRRQYLGRLGISQVNVPPTRSKPTV
ncbi:MAG: MFS transporter [archaeon]|nr:MFS transporter [archaeon]